MKVSKALLSLLFVSLLAACAGPRGIVPAQSTLPDVRASLGSPTDIRFDQNGEELWEYARGPLGTETYLIRAGKDGRVKAVTQLLTEEQFEKIKPGQSDKVAVRDLLGRPSDQAFLYNGTSWTWFVRVGPQYGQMVVHFGPNDIVLDKIILMDTGSGDTEGDRGDAG
ncbi:MAG: outer membrane protein assembly factor BamE [Gammaproteobacteria bacterium]|nr:outer membrane protein assembly factor BamE [Gammaproteobacteria bacterium]